MRTAEESSLQSSLPLPAELTLRILAFVNTPFEFRKGPNTGRKDLKNCRLVCKAFNELASPFLFDILYVSSNFEQLEILKKVSEHALFARGVKQLVYDGSSYSQDCLEWEDYENQYFFHTHVNDHCSDCNTCYLIGQGYADSIHDYDGIKDPENHREGCQEEHIGVHLRLYQQLYRDQDRIRAEGLDTQYLKAALPLLQGLTRVVYKDFVRDRWTKNLDDPPLPERMCIVPDNSSRLDFRGVHNLLQAVGSVPNRIDDLEIHTSFRILDGVNLSKPERFQSACKALSNIKKLKLNLDTGRILEEELDAEQFQPWTGVSENRIRNHLRGGIIGRLVSSAPHVRRLKINLSSVHCRRQSSQGWTLEMPLTTYLGKATWPNLEMLYLGSFDTTQDEFVEFLDRHRKIEQLDLDCITLTKGQWVWVFLVASAILPWRKLKMHKLAQTEEEKHDINNVPSTIRSIEGVTYDEDSYMDAKDCCSPGSSMTISRSEP